MNRVVRLTGTAILFTLFAGATPAADRKEIDAAVKRGADFLRQQHKNAQPGGGKADDGIGPTALAGLALLETGTPEDDPAVKQIAAAVRKVSYSETRTYQLALCLLFLDRLGDRADEPVIQLLAVRVLAGQNAAGGWTYSCIDAVPAAEEQRLRAKLEGNQLVAGERGPGGGARKPEQPAGKANPAPAGRLHPEVEKYRHALLANTRGAAGLFDDNSNTQFGVLAMWVARKHSVPVEEALDRIEKRFLSTQTPSGGWPYNGGGFDGSPSMTCAGLLGLATAMGRREERRMKAEGGKRPDLPKPQPAPEPKSEPRPNDPFFNPPPKPADPAPAPKKAAPAKHAPDPRDKAVEKGLENLAAALNGEGGGRGRNFARPGMGGPGPGRGRGLGERDMYFLWSLERVGVIFGLEKIGTVDWYQYGADLLLPAQNRDGSWNSSSYGADVDTSFALLFLARSNLVRDLTSKVQSNPANTELRAGATPPGASPPARPKVELPPVEVAVRPPQPVAPSLPRPKPTTPESLPSSPPTPVADEAAKLAAELIKAPAADWTKVLERVRDARGGGNTKALVLAIHQLDGDRKKDARDALADRLTRMSTETLRGMTADTDAELRRGAVLACAMKDDRAHVPDLIGCLVDDEELVVRAARAGLKSLSGGQDFGPAVGAVKADRKIAADAWRAWWARQK